MIMLRALKVLLVLFIFYFSTIFGNVTTVSYVSPNKGKSFCMTPEMHKECGGYCYLTYKPVLDHIMQLTDEIEKKKEELEQVEELLSRSKEVVLLGIDALKSYNISTEEDTTTTLQGWIS